MLYMGVSINGGIPRWMVYKGTSHENMDDLVHIYIYIWLSIKGGVPLVIIHLNGIFHCKPSREREREINGRMDGWIDRERERYIYIVMMSAI